MPLNVYYIVWNHNPEEKKFIEKLNTYIERDSKKTILYKIVDIGVYGELDTVQNCIVFGRTYRNLINTKGKVFIMPNIKDLMSSCVTKKKKKLEGRQTVEDIISFFSTEETKETNPAKPIVEISGHVEKEGLTFGEKGTDIIVPSHVVKYLNEVKDLIDGSIVITKNGKKIIIKE
ncbi:MAG: hypothetical protein DRH90_13135 [Deltaproteobacteria bacterium]|nr:MAG: hypothetical protein DRH90_13135 [Deltaproteobacteria bacterium]RLC18205.1 MAG: hypothetical protein DRI24_03680 [Deltaproteobacteria bacterium]